MADNLPRKKALQGDTEALLALTRALLKPLPSDKQEAANGLLRRGWIGEPDAGYAIAQDCAREQGLDLPMLG